MVILKVMYDKPYTVYHKKYFGGKWLTGRWVCMSNESGGS